jgi:hypothetical protein
MRIPSNVILSCLILVLSCVMSDCRSRNGSELDTFSAQASGYSLEIDSELELTSKDDPMLLDIILWNLQAQQADNLDGEDLTARIGLLTNPMTAQNALSSEIEFLNLGNARFWIKEQLKFPVYIDGQKLLLSMNQSSLRIQVDKQNPNIIRYKTELIANGQTNLSIEKLRNLSILLPKNPLKMFFLTNNRADAKFNVAATKDKKAKFECFATNGYAVAPFNYFDFFNAYVSESCRQKNSAHIVSIKPLNVQSSARKTVYPEFHELWKDNVLNITAAFNQGAKPWGENNFKSFVQHLKAQGYRVTQQNDQNDIELSRTIPNRPEKMIRIRAYYRDSTDDLYKILADGELKKAEIVFYSGHSGYGRFLEDLFNKNKNLPQKQYQMFFFLSCYSFSYGVSHIFANKALLDFDLDQYYADVISSARTAYFNYFEPIMQLVVKFMEKSGEVYGTPAIASQSYQNLIFAMDRLEPEDAKKAHWTIAGEERNRFDPNVDPLTIKPPAVPANRLDEMFEVAFQEAATSAERAALVGRAIQHEDPGVRQTGAKQIAKLNFEQFMSLMSDLDSDSDQTVAIENAISRYKLTESHDQKTELLGLLARRYASNSLAMNFIENFLKSESDPIRIVYTLQNLNSPDQVQFQKRHWLMVSRFLYHEYPSVEEAALCQLRSFNLNDQLFDAAMRKLDLSQTKAWLCAADLISEIRTAKHKRLAAPKLKDILEELLASKTPHLSTDLLDAIWTVGPEFLTLTNEILQDLKARSNKIEDYELPYLLRIIVVRDGRKIDPIILDAIVKAAENTLIDELYAALMEVDTLDPKLLSIMVKQFNTKPDRDFELIPAAILLNKFIPQDQKYSGFIHSLWAQTPTLRERASLLMSYYEMWKFYRGTADYAQMLFSDPNSASTPLFEITEETNSLPGVNVQLFAALVLTELGNATQKSTVRAYLLQVRQNPPSPTAYDWAESALEIMRSE